MSTTIDVIPVATLNITFGEVLAKATERIQERLVTLDIHEPVRLHVNIHKNDESVVRKVPSGDLFTWNEDEYAWFSINGIPGGTDATMQSLEGSDLESDNPWWYLKYIAENNRTVPDLEQKFEQAKLINKRIYFRRSAGQTGLIALCYGLIAASVAELTGGILWSDDGAWSVKNFPAEYDGFLQWYFVPNRALTDDNRDWAERCLEGIRDDLMEASAAPVRKPWWRFW
jgi:hypothetical protein